MRPPSSAQPVSSMARRDRTVSWCEADSEGKIWEIACLKGQRKLIDYLPGGGAFDAWTSWGAGEGVGGQMPPPLIRAWEKRRLGLGWAGWACYHSHTHPLRLTASEICPRGGLAWRRRARQVAYSETARRVAFSESKAAAYKWSTHIQMSPTAAAPCLLCQNTAAAAKPFLPSPYPCRSWCSGRNVNDMHAPSHRF